MKVISELLNKELIFFENAESKEEILRKIGRKLLENGLVKEGFIESIVEREEKYPTGIDLSVVGENLPNVAIPHSEPEYSNCKKLVVVKLEKDIKFKNMIDPSKELKVKYLFFILNNEKSTQTNILSHLMSFFTQENKIKGLENLKTKDEVYQYLIS
ncbi:PTS system IIA component (Gat family) [Thermolongibacillus altinsuensis]|uniref:PTS system IIA component (Gat family) n=1 Tax=Thermolongibacillus altinsuensis TaxID=575256 RepID=A0A4R1Q892_9BACL|nr:PTS sugar transporter subunit IIA [Thermolongibacillus altinsuensis]TCL44299.1 PTS system IIA component (Gat family) [Thermolongibacillus altinsuensis]